MARGLPLLPAIFIRMSDLDFGATVRGFTPGQKLFGRYTLKKILGRGGMGVVWLADDGKLDTPVALKFLPEVVVLDPKAMDELKREAKRNLQITHAHIVRIYDFVDDPGSAAIAMEFVDGHTFSKLGLERPDGVFTPDELKPWLAQLCDALAYAHEKARIVHRDLKPANLMVGRDGDLKVTDFGIARSIADSVTRVSANTGTSGSPPYMSPQQLNGLAPKVTDDIYAVGATLYELLTGKPPFHSGGMAAIIHQIQHAVPPSVTERRQELGNNGAPIPPAWEATIAACLAKEPQDRPQSMREFAARLIGAAAPKVLRDLRARSEPARRSGSTQNLLYAGIAAAVLVLAGAGYYFGIHVPEQQRQAAELARQTEERSRLVEEQRKQEAARTQEQKRQEAARLETEKKQQAAEEAKLQRQREILARIAGLADSAPRKELDGLDAEVKLYLPLADVLFQREISSRWLSKRKSWEDYFVTHEPGEILLQTEPAGARVTVNGVTGTSPARFEKVSPGNVTASIALPGYRRQEVLINVTAGQLSTPPSFPMVRETGSLAIDSEPRGIAFRVSGDNVVYAGKTPAVFKEIATGELQVVFEPTNGMEDTVAVRLTDGQEQKVFREFNRGAVEIRSTPAGAEVWLNGQSRGITPLVLEKQLPGSLELELRLKGYTTGRESVKLALNDRKTINVQLGVSPETALLKSFPGSRWQTGIKISEMYFLNFIDAEYLTVDYKDNTLIGSYPSSKARAKVVQIDAASRVVTVRALELFAKEMLHLFSEDGEFQFQLLDNDSIATQGGGKKQWRMIFKRQGAEASLPR